MGAEEELMLVVSSTHFFVLESASAWWVGLIVPLFEFGRGHL